MEIMEQSAVVGMSRTCFINSNRNIDTTLFILEKAVAFFM